MTTRYLYLLAPIASFIVWYAGMAILNTPLPGVP